jgi:hypothetical protein
VLAHVKENHGGDGEEAQAVNLRHETSGRGDAREAGKDPVRETRYLFACGF